MKRLIAILCISLAPLASAAQEAPQAEAPEQAAGKDALRMFDGFDGKAALDWQVRHPDAEHAGYEKVPGTLTIVNGVFPFGIGDLSLTFRAAGDGVPVDPYVVDLRQAEVVEIDAQVGFHGATPLGLDLDAQSDLSVTTLQNDPDGARTTVDGTWDILLDGYDADLSATDLQLDFDLVAAEVTHVIGDIEGTVDIPDFAADAEFVLTGLGTRVDLAVDMLYPTLRWTVDLVDL